MIKRFITAFTGITRSYAGAVHFLKQHSTMARASTEPYEEASVNFIYNLLFCDSLELYKANAQTPLVYPFDILFSETSSATELQTVIDDGTVDSRVKVLAYNKQVAGGYQPNKKELLAVIVEVGLDAGLDVLASFTDGTARYINHTGKILVWETTDETSSKLTDNLFLESQKIVANIGPWNKPRRPHPTRGDLRITFLVSDGLYFGEGPIDTLFNDPMASPALINATELMKHITEKALESE